MRLIIGLYIVMNMIIDNFLDYDYFFKRLGFSSFRFLLDNLSLGYGFVVIFISGNVFLFRINYIDGDYLRLRFI